ncbi:MAG: hypothetical protein LUH15_08665 [Tannerellaceae bacterium]|nr:hypothetical protein [Tannerellaceae bacterium]
MRERTLSRRDKEDSLYEQLQENSLAAYQNYCGDIWTDFNTHDPGITISDILNYALYELAYQLEFPPESYLGKGERNRWNKIGLLPPGKLFDFSPVTPSDYEKTLHATF